MSVAQGEDKITEIKEETFVAKSNASSSVVWQYFGFEPTDVAQANALCKTCRMVVSRTKGNTTNLFSHLKNHHKPLYDECMILPRKKPVAVNTPLRAKQASLASAFASGTKYDKNSKRHTEITNAITYYLAKDIMSIHTVEKKGFKKLLDVLDKRYQIPSRTYFSQVAIPQLYEQCRKAVQAEFGVGKIEYFSSTTDLWSSRTTEPYISLTVHYITPEYELVSKCLQTSYFPEDHTGQNISVGLRDALYSWGLLPEHQVAITTDNGTNIKKAAELNKWQRLQCFGHLLHNAVENATKDDARIDKATKLCKKIVGHFSHSWKKRRALTEAQKELNLPEHALVTECPTRWGSKQHMIERVLEQQKAVALVLSADKSHRHLVPTWQDIEVLESINKALSPLQDFTDALSGESYVSVSSVKPVLHLLNTQALIRDEEDTELTQSIKSKVLQYLNAKWDQATEDLLDMASFVDPRFKTKYVSEERVPILTTRVLSEMKEIARKNSGTEPRDQTVPLPAPPPSKKPRRSLGSLLKSSTTTPAVQVLVDDAVTAEFNSYLLTPSIDSEDDPLAWWKCHKVSYPSLSKLARKYLCIPATSSPSERIFSTGGNIVTAHRSRLKPAMVDMLVFLTCNL